MLTISKCVIVVLIPLTWVRATREDRKVFFLNRDKTSAGGLIYLFYKFIFSFLFRSTFAIFTRIKSAFKSFFSYLFLKVSSF